MRDDKLYRHHKGDYYFVEWRTAIDATNESTVGEVVVYRNLKGQKFVREVDEFFDTNTDYWGGHRFRLIENYRIALCNAETEETVDTCENCVPTHLYIKTLEEEESCDLKLYVDVKKDGDTGQGRYPYFEVGQLSFSPVEEEPKPEAVSCFESSDRLCWQCNEPHEMKSNYCGDCTHHDGYTNTHRCQAILENPETGRSWRCSKGNAHSADHRSPHSEEPPDVSSLKNRCLKTKHSVAFGLGNHKCNKHLGHRGLCGNRHGDFSL